LKNGLHGLFGGAGYSRKYSMSMENDGGMMLMEKLKNSEKILSQCHFVRHISHMD
jgi:hypothetical protein